jgi:hypothetical protein
MNKLIILYFIAWSWNASSTDSWKQTMNIASTTWCPLSSSWASWTHSCTCSDSLCSSRKSSPSWPTAGHSPYQHHLYSSYCCLYHHFNCIRTACTCPCLFFCSRHPPLHPLSWAHYCTSSPNRCSNHLFQLSKNSLSLIKITNWRAH